MKQEPKNETPSLLFYLSHFSRGVWLSFLVLCSQTARKRLLRRLKVSWQAFPSLPPSSRASGVSPAPKTPFPFPFKRLPRRLLHCKPVMSQAQHFAQTARRGWLVRASRFARNAAFSLLGSKRASHAGKSLGCSNRSSHSITNQGEKKTKV